MDERGKTASLMVDLTASLLGRRVRTKSTEQIITELDAMHDVGWGGNVFFHIPWGSLATLARSG